ncbi:MAG TPA: SDR family NAD(P)-dependent oxidoreductase [Candidatus Binatia bacterium]|nr:SDR family NAD(P)-dependent oxidoreductase [Candidatus Binatia bacterium]
MHALQVAVVSGVGPGLGAAVARRFARGGFAVALMARAEESLAAVAAAIAAEGGHALPIPGDATHPDAVARAFGRVRAELGAPEVLVYNTGAFHIGGVLDTTPAVFEQCWRASCLGAVLAVQQVLPAMVERGRGTVLLTGATAALRGAANFAAMAVGKFGLRALGQSLAREFGPRGIHVAHVVVDGIIDTPRTRAFVPDRPAATLLAPDAIAEAYWQLHVQQPTCWTQEMDLRPAPEKF